jgi:hypothetical protein
MSSDDILSGDINAWLGLLPHFDPHRCIPSVVHGKSRQDESYGWNSRKPGPHPILEDRAFQPVRGPEDRPLDHSSLPDVLC